MTCFLLRQIRRFIPTLISDTKNIVRATGEHEEFKHLLDSNTKVKGNAISTYGELIAKHSTRKIYFFDSYNWLNEVEATYEKGGISAVREAMKERKDRYSSKSTKKMELDKRTAAELILIPINCDKDHWILGVFDKHNTRLLLYDSLQSRHHQGILECMKVFAEIYLEPGIEWKEDDAYVELPHQGMTIDCGIYVMAYMRAIAHARHQEIDFEKKDIPFLRALFLYEIYHKSLKTVGI